MIDLAHLKALRPDLPPILLYVHENQFAYPLAEGEARDMRYGWTDLVNILVSRRSLFNSKYNRDSFFAGAAALLARLPDAVPKWSISAAREKTAVCYPGVEPIESGSPAETERRDDKGGPIVVWNHRHEHDKGPEDFVRALTVLHDEGVRFRLALLGERFAESPPAFDELRRRLGDRIVVDAYPSAEKYREWLRRGDVVISTARQENFGFSVVEAILAGCLPLLPHRLAYPEILPTWAHDEVLWKGPDELVTALRKVLSRSVSDRRRFTEPLTRWIGRYSWPERVLELDNAVENTVAQKQESSGNGNG